MKRGLAALAASVAMAGGAPAMAAPVFQLGVDNTLGFQAVGNKTGSPTSFAVGDVLYGVLNLQDISAGTTSWNANNVSMPYDSVTGYFVSQITAVNSTYVPGFGTFYNLTMGVASSDPNGVFSAGDLAAKTILKLFTDTTTPFTTSGPVSTDIARATNGSLWLSMGMTSANDYWSVAIAPTGWGSGTSGGLDLIANNTGLSFSKVLDTNCNAIGGCLVDMKFVSTVSATGGGAWAININDPGVMHPVPLPAAVWLLGSGLAGLLGFATRRRSKHEEAGS
jgi:hypothetical protein